MIAFAKNGEHFVIWTAQPFFDNRSRAGMVATDGQRSAPKTSKPCVTFNVVVFKMVGIGRA
jgi:hypothetical protein